MTTFDDRSEKRGREGLSSVPTGSSSDGNNDGKDTEKPSELPSISPPDRPKEQEERPTRDNDSPDLPDFLKPGKPDQPNNPSNFIQPVTDQETRQAMNDFYKSDSSEEKRDQFESNEFKEPKRD